MECQALWCNVVLNICSIILMVKTLSKIIKQSWKSSISKKCWRTGKIIRQTTKTHKSYKIRKQKKSARTDVTSSIQPRRLKLLLSLRSFYMYLYYVTNMILNSLHALNQYGFCILSKSSFIKRWQYSFSCYLKKMLSCIRQFCCIFLIDLYSPHNIVLNSINKRHLITATKN